MKRALKAAAAVVAVLAVILAALLGYLTYRYPITDAPTAVRVESSAERIARGKYLATHVAVCIDCHSTRDWNYYSGPPIAGTYGKGGEVFDAALGFPGTIIAPNLTPAGIGGWTDGELLRAITCGVTKDGRALFPLMPYPSYNLMDREDLFAIVAYLRTLQPIAQLPPTGSLNFPMNLIVRTIPLKTYMPSTRPPATDTVAYGKYLAGIAGCADCHTQQEKGKPLPGMHYAGGFAFGLPGGVLRSANITPDAETGIGKWTREQFIAKFKAVVGDSAFSVPADPNGYITIMPWSMYGGMTEQDLGAIYAYLRTLPPVRNSMIRFDAGKRLQ